MSTTVSPKRPLSSLSTFERANRAALRTIPLPNSPIPEESFVKEKYSAETPGSASTNTNEHSTPSSIDSSPPKPTTAQSVMAQNVSPSILSNQSTPKTSTSVLEGLGGKKMRRFGTFSTDGLNLNSKTASFAPSASIRSSNTDVVHASVKFIDKGDWVDSSKCYICIKEFKKMTGVFEHHCRACGQAVCGDCSSKKIIDNRVCDICYLKTKNARAEKRREDQLRSKNATMKTYKKQLLKEKDDLDELIQKKFELNKKIEEEKLEQAKAVNGLQKERDRAAEILMKKKETNIKLRESLAIDKNFLKDKESEFDELQNKIRALKVQIGQKKNNFDSKQEELARLFRQMKTYQESPSFINLVSKLPEGTNFGSIRLDDETMNSLDLGRSTQPNSRTKI